MEMSPRKSSHQLGQECGISKISVLRDLKGFRFHSYKMLVFQKLIPADPVVCINFCRWMLQSAHDEIIDPMLLSISGEAVFYLSGFLNAQNTHWDTENSDTVHEVPLHEKRVGVCCAVRG
jgi:hypothetical protein